ncbi:MAG: hypothetical protein ACK4NX_03545, partial [Candidatus Paceibacteria bacterium]
MSRIAKFGTVAGLVLGLVFAFAVLARDEDEDEDEARPGQGPVKALEKALDRLEKFEFKGFEENEFIRGTAPSS